MTDLFSQIQQPRRLKVGQANGEFLAALASLPAHQRALIRPSDFPDACPEFVRANIKYWGGSHA